MEPHYAISETLLIDDATLVMLRVSRRTSTEAINVLYSKASFRFPLYDYLWPELDSHHESHIHWPSQSACALMESMMLEIDPSFSFVFRQDIVSHSISDMSHIVSLRIKKLSCTVVGSILRSQDGRFPAQTNMPIHKHMTKLLCAKTVVLDKILDGQRYKKCGSCHHSEHLAAADYKKLLSNLSNDLGILLGPGTISGSTKADGTPCQIFITFHPAEYLASCPDAPDRVHELQIGELAT